MKIELFLLAALLFGKIKKIKESAYISAHMRNFTFIYLNV